MIPIKHTITRRGLGFEAKEWRAILQAAWFQLGAFWHAVILPKHFTEAGGREYGYQERANLYMRRKWRKFGHAKPLVWQGSLERDVRRIVDVRASSSGARVVLHGPQYLYQYRKDLSQPDKARELTAISPRDAGQLAYRLDAFIQEGIDRADGGGMSGSFGHQAAGLADARPAAVLADL